MDIDSLWIVAKINKDSKLLVKFTWLLKERPLGLYIDGLEEFDDINVKWTDNIDNTSLLEFPIYKDDGSGFGNIRIKLSTIYITIQCDEEILIARPKFGTELSKRGDTYSTSLDEQVKKLNSRLKLIGSSDGEKYTDGISIFSIVHSGNAFIGNVVGRFGRLKNAEITVDNADFIDLDSISGKLVLHIRTMNADNTLRYGRALTDDMSVTMKGCLNIKNMSGLDLSQVGKVERVYSCCYTSTGYIDASKYKLIGKRAIHSYNDRRTLVIDFGNNVCAIHPKFLMDDLSRLKICAENPKMVQRLRDIFKDELNEYLVDREYVNEYKSSLTQK